MADHSEGGYNSQQNIFKARIVRQKDVLGIC